jgi:DNA-binding MurR/RpiR family transcriptional regulator
VGFREALRHKGASMTESDRRIGNTILMSPHEVPFFTAAQLARKADVHESTVVRFAQKLGYPGYPEMRADLAEDIARQGGAAVARLVPKAKDPALAAIVRTQIEVLAELPAMISQGTIDDACSALVAANYVCIVGRGLFTAPAEFLARKLGMMGVPNSVISQGGGEAVERTAQLKRGDVVIVFAFNEEFKGLAPLVSALTDRGVRAILVTDHATLLDSWLPEFVLTVPRRSTRHGVMVALMVVCYAIEYGVLAQAPDHAYKSWNLIAELATASQLPHALSSRDEAPPSADHIHQLHSETE